VSLVVSTGLCTVNAPDVVGQTQALATTAITGLGLVAGDISQECSNTVAVGLVVRQIPEAGAATPFGGAVSLVVSTGLCTVNVPGVTNQAQEAATEAVIVAGLTLGTVTQACSNTVAAGLVISQSPEADVYAPFGAAVSLVVSTGVCDVTVPDVTGQTEAAAAVLLSDAGLVAGAVAQQCSDSVGVGLVVSQTPAAGTQALLGAAIALVVSTGPCSAEGEGELPTDVLVPNVVGAASEEAETTLTQVGLNMSVEEENSDTVPAGEVIRQQPAAGTMVTPGVTVLVTVSSGPKETGCACTGGNARKDGTFFDGVKNSLGDLLLSVLSLVVALPLVRRRLL